MAYYDEDEARIRKQVEKRFKERQGLWIHFSAFLLTNIMLWIFWALINPATTVMMQGGRTFEAVTGAFPWPMFVTVGWSIGIVAHFISYYNKYGRGAERREEAIQREIERYRESHMYEKPKNDFDRPLGINDDGELEEIYEDEPAGSRKRR